VSSRLSRAGISSGKSVILMRSDDVLCVEIRVMAECSQRYIQGLCSELAGTAAVSLWTEEKIPGSVMKSRVRKALPLLWRLEFAGPHYS